MKIFIKLLLLGLIYSEVERLSPGIQVNNRIKYNETSIFQVNAGELKQNHFYKIMVHYLGSVKFIFYKVRI